MDYEKIFNSWPEALKRVIVQTYHEEGANPLGDRLIANSDMYMLRYGGENYFQDEKSGKSFGMPQMVYKVGSELKARVGDGKTLVVSEVKAIKLDLVSSKEWGKPVFVLIAERKDEYGGPYPAKVIAGDVEMTYQPPIKPEEQK